MNDDRDEPGITSINSIIDLNMNELKKKQKQIQQMIRDDYRVVVSNRWLHKYLYLFAKCTPLEKITMADAVDIVLERPDLFAYFIYGQRAEYVNNKMMEKAKAKDTVSNTSQIPDTKTENEGEMTKNTPDKKTINE